VVKTKNQKEMWDNEEKLTLEDRRNRYKCYKYIQVDDIRTWAQLIPNISPEIIQSAKKRNVQDLPKNKKFSFQPNQIINEKVALYHGDITTIEIDAIVNAANTGCRGGGGVDGAIHSAAGKKLYNECVLLNGCPTGQTKITRGYSLPAKYVLHSVGPIGENPQALKSCYFTSLQLLVKYDLKTIALCGISTGIYGYPTYKATHVALRTVRKWLEKGNNKDKVNKIVFFVLSWEEKNQLMRN